MTVVIEDKVLRRDAAITSSLLFGFSGLDRLYTGCYASGVIKFLIFVMFMIAGSGPVVKGVGSAIEVKFLLGLVVLVWYFYDLYAVSMGAMRGSSTRPYCGGYVWLDSDYTKYYGAFALVAAFGMFYWWLNF